MTVQIPTPSPTHNHTHYLNYTDMSDFTTFHSRDPSSGGDSVMSTTTQQLEDIQAGFNLLELTDELIQRNPGAALTRMLSQKTAISTSSSYAERMRLTDEDTAYQLFIKIGAGTCGAVFQQSGTIRVMKRAKAEQWADQLWNDYKIHALVFEGFAAAASLKTDIKITKAIEYIGKDDKQGRTWWSANKSKFPEGDDYEQDILITDRIMPLPKPLRHCLISLYCPSELKSTAPQNPSNADCLVRVYLGAHKPVLQGRPEKFFTLRNFNLYLDMLKDIALEPHPYAISMAQSLAVMHWQVRCDADDVEFVLGSSPVEEDVAVLTAEEISALPPRSSSRPQALNLKRRVVHLWMLDYNRVKSITMDQAGVNQAVKAFFANDPYYPRPSGKAADSDLWTVFKDTYLDHSAGLKVLQELQTKAKVDWIGLPEAFIEEVEAQQTVRSQKQAEAEMRSPGTFQESIDGAASG
ncbi:hypothetical protein LTR86_006337 [Recurvomyces mirabilis]|nr:hypothetical protein LTR86_006337 [Recurvomyces mirabilis]